MTGKRLGYAHKCIQVVIIQTRYYRAVFKTLLNQTLALKTNILLLYKKTNKRML